MNENKKYYVKGGVACDFNDCFACDDEKCTLLKVSYKEDEICPFYKSISKDDVITEALTSTYNYAIRRENELAKQIEEKEQIIKELEDATKKTIKQLKKEIGKQRVASKVVKKEKAKALEEIEAHAKEESEDANNNDNKELPERN